jgi:predicted metal-dependent hydrolase
MQASDTQRRVFKNRVHHWAEKLEVKINWLAVRPMRNKWASCSTNGHLHFYSELLDLDNELWDYVIVHELLHFSVPNHGKLWKCLMRAHLGNYDAMARLLDRRSSPSFPHSRVGTHTG